MNFLIGNPGLLAALALAAIPVAIHFFAKVRPRILKFSSVRFLDQIVRRTTRLQRPRNWLILILRTLLFLAIIGMLLQPVLIGGDFLSSEGGRTVVLVIDRSASMGVVDGARTRFAAACARGTEILSELRDGDRANVVWMDREPHAEFPAPGPNIGALRVALPRASASLEAANVPAALALAVEQVREARGAVEIFVISDFQSTNWANLPELDFELADLIAVPIGASTIGNQAITKVSTPQPRLMLSGETEILVEIFNYSDQPVSRTLFVRSGEYSDSREVSIGPWQAAGAAFATRFGKAGERAITVEISPDDFPFDDRRFTTVEIVPTIRVGIVGSDSSTREQWDRVFTSIPWLDVRKVLLDDASALNDLDVVAVAGGELTPELQDFRARGGGVLFMPNAADQFQGASLSRETSPEGFKLRVADVDHGMLEIFRSGEAGDPTSGRVKNRLTFEVEGSKGIRPILEFSDGRPAVAEWNDEGGLVLWLAAMSPDDPWIARPEFVALMGELIDHLAWSRAAAFSGDVAGSRAGRTFSHQILPEEVSLRHEAITFAVQSISTEENRFETKEALPPGVYEWQARNQPVGYSVINFPVEESDLRLLPEPPQSIFDKRITPETSVQELREGTALWPWFLTAAIALALAEAFVVLAGANGIGRFSIRPAARSRENRAMEGVVNP